MISCEGLQVYSMYVYFSITVVHALEMIPCI